MDPTFVEAVIAVDGQHLHGDLTLPKDSRGLVMFAHGSGSSRHSPRNQRVARVLQDAHFSTLLLDLLTDEEEARDAISGELRFDIVLLAERLVVATAWLNEHGYCPSLRLGLFGSSTGAAAALMAAAQMPDKVHAIVSRGGRPDLAGPHLQAVHAPTLFIVGGHDTVVLGLNRAAAARLRCEHGIEIVPAAGHLFEEPGALERVSGLARDWFAGHLARDEAPIGSDGGHPPP